MKLWNEYWSWSLENVSVGFHNVMYYNFLCMYSRCTVMGNTFWILTHNSLFHKLESIQLKHSLIFNPHWGDMQPNFRFIGLQWVRLEIMLLLSFHYERVNVCRHCTTAFHFLAQLDSFTGCQISPEKAMAKCLLIAFKQWEKNTHESVNTFSGANKLLLYLVTDQMAPVGCVPTGISDLHVI